MVKDNLKSKISKSEKQLKRVRQICLALPETSEKTSHGAPTFFVKKKVFVMFADNHDDDGRLAVWLPVPVGEQEILINASQKIFFKPPYVGVRGWVGIELAMIPAQDLTAYIQDAWTIIAPKTLAQKTNTLRSI